MLRERQKRSEEAAALWMATKTIPAWWHRPADFEGRLAAIGQAVPFERGADLLMKLRTVTFPGTPAEDFTEEVLFLIGSNGRIEGMKDLTKKNEAAFDRLVPRLGTARMSLSSPDEHPVKLVRRGVLACYHLTNCSVVKPFEPARATNSPTR